MIKLAPRLLAAVLTNLMMVGMGNAYDHDKGDVLKQQDVKSSSTVERSLNIFQDPQESNSGTISTHEQQNEETTAHSAKSSPSAISSKSAKTNPPTMSLTSPLKAVVKLYTLDVDFQTGSSININHDDVHDQLQLDSTSEPFNFIWVACSNRGTIVKVDTLTGTILGQYKSAPRTDGNPSRTTVDKDGSVWLSNRNDIGPNRRGTIVHIGLLENNQREDRNGDNVIQTSTGLGDIKPWAAGGTRGVQFAEDECIVHYTEVSSTGTRHVSIDADNNVWVSGSGYEAFDKVKGGRYDTVDVDGKHSGDILKSFPSVGYGGYGGLMDPNGVIWSANYLLRWDTSKPLDGPNGDPAGDSSIGPHDKNWAGQTSPGSYGLCIDSQGNVWNTELGSGIHKYAPNGAHIARYTHGFSAAQGCVVDKNDDVWVAHSILNGGHTVGHLRNDGTYLGSVTVGNGPSGVAVDKAGKIWATNTQSSTLSRIDPALGIAGEVDMTVELGSGCYPYNYGDMTGSTNIAPPNTGSWTVMYDYGSVLATWGGMNIEWTAETPGDSSVTVQVRTNEADPWMPMTNGQNLSSLNGQYLHVQVNFSRDTTSGASPLLEDLSIVLVTPTSTPTSMPTSKPSPTKKSQLRTTKPTNNKK